MTKLCWEKEYAINKFLPLLTRWHLIHDDLLQANILMTKIIKKRVNKRIKSYEVKWNNYDITTNEPKVAVQMRYPKEVTIYEDTHTKSTKQKSNLCFFKIYFIFYYKTYKKNFSVSVHDSDLIGVTDKLLTMKISKKHVISKKTNKIKNSTSMKGPLDQFVIRKNVKDISLTLSDFECDSIDLNLSDIVNGIIA